MTVDANISFFLYKKFFPNILRKLRFCPQQCENESTFIFEKILLFICTLFLRKFSGTSVISVYMPGSAIHVWPSAIYKVLLFLVNRFVLFLTRNIIYILLND